MAELYSGQRFGKLTLRQRVAPNNKTSSPNLRKRWRVECECGARLTIPEYYLVRKPNPKTSCGCDRGSIKTLYKREYGIWMMMHQRCYNPQHVSYKHYGGRGITIDPSWHKDHPDGEGFTRFINFIGPSPSPQHTIDRVDNNGHYQPFQADGKTPQVRWATATEQRANQRS